MMNNLIEFSKWSINSLFAFIAITNKYIANEIYHCLNKFQVLQNNWKRAENSSIFENTTTSASNYFRLINCGIISTLWDTLISVLFILTFLYLYFIGFGIFGKHATDKI